MWKRRLNEAGAYLLALVWLAVAAFPIFFMGLTAFKTMREFLVSPWELPSRLNLSNFGSVWASDFPRYLTNSVFVSVVSVLLIVALSSLAAYAFARMTFPGRRPLFLWILAGMMIPIHITLIPIYIMTQRMGTYDTLVALIGPYVGFGLPISVFILTEFFSQIPKELEDASRIDGCTYFQTFYRITLPLAGPALATVAIYNLIGAWNEFIFASVLLQSPEAFTLPLGLRQLFGQFGIDTPAVMATVLLGSLPTILFFVVFQERVVSGLTAGALRS
ncbi:ABC transporter permease [Limnochorda pilosa]|uniref:ABC transporter permease n=1 Tax=Limnochorda pilosa TaxID=1555112 RepID=A0A0K2SLS6_LIMPI|nr:ABC transporter permease [Limnochorda pilosa]